jgi:hypothetical protein
MTFSPRATSLALALGLCAAGPLAAATDLSFSNLSGAEYDTAGVYVLGDVSFTADTDDGGGYDDVLFQLWDDGVVKFEETYSLLVGDSGTFHFEVYYPGLVGTDAQGVGLELTDTPSGGYIYLDPFDVPHYADPSQCERDCGPPAVPLPASFPLLAAGIGGLLAFARRRKPS